MPLASSPRTHHSPLPPDEPNITQFFGSSAGSRCLMEIPGAVLVWHWWQIYTATLPAGCPHPFPQHFHLVFFFYCFHLSAAIFHLFIYVFSPFPLNPLTYLSYLLKCPFLIIPTPESYLGLLLSTLCSLDQSDALLFLHGSPDF